MARKPKSDKEKKAAPEKPKTSKPKKTPKEKKPAKEKKVPKTKGGKKKLSHPPYRSMSKRAIAAAGDKKEGYTYVSFQQILKYIQTNYKVSERARRYLKIALNKGVAEKYFVQLRASYRLSSKTSKRKSATKRSRAKKTEKEGSTKKRASPSKPKRASGEKKVKKAKKAEGEKSKPKAKSEMKRIPSNSFSPKSKHAHIWQFAEVGKWYNYDVEASDKVEDVYLGYLSNRGDTDVRAIKSGQWEYMVDFMAMKQTNIQHPNHTIRDIRRVANTFKGTDKN